MGSNRNCNHKDNNNNNNPFCDLLETIPPNYTVENVFANGNDIGVTNFVTIDTDTGLAQFFNGDSVLTVNCRSIDAIDWE
ncbi:MAG TPA: hypothetical protein VK119_09575 [Bacillota bacterium]|nr:hypothetical protein [Bacillota bacterium]